MLDFETARAARCETWFSQDGVRIAEYYRIERYERTICLLSDGRSVDKSEIEDALDELAEQDITVTRERKAIGKRVVMSLVSGDEELDGPHETVFTRIPIVTVYANRKLIEGRWYWCGMVRFSRDPQKLVNYNFTTAQELLAKQPKAPYLVTPKMLEGAGVKKMWDRANAMDAPYLPFTPDPSAPNNAPTRLQGPEFPAAFTNMSQMAVDMLKASDGIYDASLGARSNETSGRAIQLRQQEGDTATFDYQDALNKGIQATGRILGQALPKVFDTPRQVRILGQDGSEKFVQLYQEVKDRQTGRTIKINDLSKGKYDYTVTSGVNYDTQRMEFADTLSQLAQSSELVAQAVPDLIVGAMDFPKAQEAAERLKLLLPDAIQRKLQQDTELPAEVQQAMDQVEQQMQQIQQQAQALSQDAAKIEQDKAQVIGDKAAVAAQSKEIQAQRAVLNAEYATKKAELENLHLRFQLAQQTREQHHADAAIADVN